LPARAPTFARFVGFAAAALLAAALLLCLWVYARSEAHLRSFGQPPPFRLTLAATPAVLARGLHVAQTRGCTDCHRGRFEGGLFHDEGWEGRLVAPNLAALARTVPPAALEAAIRHAVGHDGRALYAMPSYNFLRLSDDDVSALILLLRAAPVARKDLPTATLGPLRRWKLATGRDAAMPAFLAQVPPLRWQGNKDPAIVRGEYLAMTSCNECHGFDLRGNSPFGAAGPDLIVVGGYGKDDFVKLMRTAVPVGGRVLKPLMAEAVKKRFVHWTDAEVGDLYAFLSAMSRAAPPS
jgi:mono/diheme cytochrome c family protein